MYDCREKRTDSSHEHRCSVSSGKVGADLVFSVSSIQSCVVSAVCGGHVDSSNSTSHVVALYINKNEMVVRFTDSVVDSVNVA